MITKLSFQNYKLFKEKQELELKPLTILIGKNSSGKSAITKLLPLIENSLSGGLRDVPLSLENYGVSLGAEFKDLVYGRHKVGVLEFELETDKNKLNVQIASGTRIGAIPKIVSWNLNDEVTLKYRYDKTGYNYIDVEADKKYKLGFNGFQVQYVYDSPLNMVPDEFYYDNNIFSLLTNYIGPYRFVPDRIIKFSSESIQNNKLDKDGAIAYPFLIRDVLYNDRKILNKISHWYKKNFEDWELKINISNPPNYELELFRDTPELIVNFTDVGQGMVQALPLILSSFMPSPNENLINVFEQPELHLHHAAHGNLAERFSESTMDSSKRYLIETHSQNFILRLRRLVAEGKLDKENLAIYYIYFDEDKGESNLRRISVNAGGEVDFWPTNIFNESLDEVFAIRKAQKRNGK